MTSKKPIRIQRKRVKNLVAHLNEWTDDDGNTRRELSSCTFYQFHNSLQGHSAHYHGVVSEADLEENGGIWVVSREKISQ